ncbi:MAG: glycosyltransferase family 2 protein, partial [Clostridiales bacterium]|nr:glycosyltransferase family 2 protein [Clostridiales bacterium]
MAIEISLCMIVKDEEGNLGNCLKSIDGIFDEINIIDTGSNDRTVEIARQYTDRVYFYKWGDDFAAARNFSFSKATREYIMWLDADDVITPGNVLKLKKLKKILSRDIMYVSMYYYYSFDEKGRPLLTHKRDRIVKRSAGFLWIGAIHEYIDVSGKGLVVDIYVNHNAGRGKGSHKRNFKILDKLIKSGNKDIRIIRYYAIGLFDEGDYDKALEYMNIFIDMNKREKI